jgi:hypothetical protein
VTITGTNLKSVRSVNFHSREAGFRVPSGRAQSFVVNSGASITAVSPGGSGPVDVTVTNARGTSSLSAADTFEYVPDPTVSTVQPNVGPEAGGSTVTITGTNLNTATAVTFGSAAATSFKAESPTSLTAVSPPGKGPIDVTVTNPTGTSVIQPADRFTYIPKPPTLGACPVSSITQTSATLCATVNPNDGEVSECTFEYGTTEAYGQTAPCMPTPGLGESAVAVSASVKELVANTTYHFRVSATNLGGTSKGSDQTVKTLPKPPTVVTGVATEVKPTSAKLNATVNPNGGEVSKCTFEYGTTTAYGTKVPCVPPPGSRPNRSRCPPRSRGW